MSDRITAEEVERIADELAAGWDSERLRGRACVAIRSLAAERDELRIAAINAAYACRRVQEIVDLAPEWWNDPSTGVGKIAADAELELRATLAENQP